MLSLTAAGRWLPGWGKFPFKPAVGYKSLQILTASSHAVTLKPARFYIVRTQDPEKEKRDTITINTVVEGERDHVRQTAVNRGRRPADWINRAGSKRRTSTSNPT